MFPRKKHGNTKISSGASGNRGRTRAELNTALRANAAAMRPTQPSATMPNAGGAARAPLPRNRTRRFAQPPPLRGQHRAQRHIRPLPADAPPAPRSARAPRK
eukprot:scaffold61882_cov58-Phaeocystis_antarctica.AAC.3